MTKILRTIRIAFGRWVLTLAALLLVSSIVSAQAAPPIVPQRVQQPPRGGAPGQLAPPVRAAAQQQPLPQATAGTRVADLVISDGTLPVRLMGYGLVVGLDGTGDRAIGGRSSGHTVQSVANLLKRFDVEVPAEVLRTRNVAAVLVTAEISPFLRSGGRFEVHVASIGDARSLRGGVLWMTPLIAEVGGQPIASAQGPMLISEGSQGGGRDRYAGYNQNSTVETTARMPQGGLIETDLPRPTLAAMTQLMLREPNLATASRIAAAVDSALGAGTATVDDPGSITLALKADSGAGGRAGTLAKIRELRVRPDRPARIVIDGRDGTVVAGGDIGVGEAVVSHGGVTLSIGAGGADTGNSDGNVRVPPGTTVQAIAAALHAVQTPPTEIAAIFAALREVGAISAEVIVR
ncbi:MAG: flagellar basal body P-ring protein FlgI [Gemmatimonadota bacterium]|nr:flagellar basal body P-ring protein FlgI [Gemmatimonadota bacterium]